MAAIVKFLCLFFFLSLFSQGHCQCTLRQVSIKQSKTGQAVQGKPVWGVTITNGCPCSQSDLKLSCNGFQTVQPVNPSALSKSGNQCLVNNGAPVSPSSSVSFTYAWDTSFPFHPVSSQINCS